MTLKEAHELQRKELISLRAKVARLEKSSGLFTAEEKEVGFDLAPLFLPSVGIISPVSGSILPIRVLLALEHFFSLS